MDEVNIYIETSIKGPKRRAGAYGYILEQKTEAGPVTLTKLARLEYASENQSEMQALIAALGRMRRTCMIHIYTESNYVASAFTNGWVDRWRAAGWKGSKGKEIANIDEWQEILKLLDRHVYDFRIGSHHEYRAWLQGEVENEAGKEI